MLTPSFLTSTTSSHALDHSHISVTDFMMSTRLYNSTRPHIKAQPCRNGLVSILITTRNHLCSRSYAYSIRCLQQVAISSITLSSLDSSQTLFFSQILFTPHFLLHQTVQQKRHTHSMVCNSLPCTLQFFAGQWSALNLGKVRAWLPVVSRLRCAI